MFVVFNVTIRFVMFNGTVCWSCLIAPCFCCCLMMCFCFGAIFVFTNLDFIWTHYYLSFTNSTILCEFCFWDERRNKLILVAPLDSRLDCWGLNGIFRCLWWPRRNLQSLSWDFKPMSVFSISHPDSSISVSNLSFLSRT